MTASAELLHLLDGPAIESLDADLSFHVDPDPVLEAARLAVSTGSGLESALAAVEDQDS